MKSESWLMSCCKRLGAESVAWSLRRLHCPVPVNALVLEVGSGGNPYPRANVLLDAYENTRERHWVPLKTDRPTVLGFVERLPFKDKAFDFVIASHVLEHSPDPAKFLSELQRVGKAGYIEVPDAFMERINPYRDHRLEITLRNGALKIRKKPFWIAEADTVELYEHQVKPFLTKELIPKHPFAFHLRYYWDTQILFSVVNPETDAAWAPLPSRPESVPVGKSLSTLFKDSALNLFRALLSQRGRNRNIDLCDLLMCPKCSAGKLSQGASNLTCQTCSAVYEIKNGIPQMFCS